MRSAAFSPAAAGTAALRNLRRTQRSGEIARHRGQSQALNNSFACGAAARFHFFTSILEFLAPCSYFSPSIRQTPAVPPDPKAPIDLTTLDEAFRDAIAAATGDPVDTAAKKTAREALQDGLRKDANYVQTQSSHSQETLLSSGFTAASTNHAQIPLTPALIQELSNAGTTRFLLRLMPVANARSYHVH